MKKELLLTTLALLLSIAGQAHKPAFNGLAQILVQSYDKPSVITLRCLSDGLKTGNVVIQSLLR